MKASELIAHFEQMYREHWRYEWGAAEKGCVDCSGAFVYAFRLHNQSIYHGSNTIARKYISGPLLPISECKPGYAVFKQRFDGKEPEKYQNDGLGNIYHIGCMGTDGNVLNAEGTNAGFTNRPLSKWHLCAPLKGVDYEETGDDGMMYAIVSTENGGSLNIRKECSTKAGLVCTAPNGAKLEYLGGADEGWAKVRYNGQTGYAMEKYLRVDNSVSLEERVAILEQTVASMKSDIAALKAEMERY